jgi:hypothetical protein
VVSRTANGDAIGTHDWAGIEHKSNTTEEAVSALSILGLALILWGAATILTAWFKPGPIWRTPKIQGFVQLLGEKGAVVLFLTLGVIAVAGGIIILR